MDKQFSIYSVDTKAFYTDKENEINKQKIDIRNEMKAYEEYEKFKLLKNDEVCFDEYKVKYLKCIELLHTTNRTKEENIELNHLKSWLKYSIKINRTSDFRTKQEKAKEISIEETKLNKELHSKLSNNESYVALKQQLKDLNTDFSKEIEKFKGDRYLNPKVLTQYNKITLFENSLSRAMDIKADETITDIIVVRVYHYTILKQIINGGFKYIDENGNTKKYKVFTASAGQIRTKKVIFIEEDKWFKYEKTLMCGLTIDRINKSKELGCNINKFLAYLALCNSATDEIEGFNIDESIVVDDFETLVEGEVDYIDNKTFKVTRQIMKVPIPHSDGCGMMLPSVSKKNYMIRLPWVKGLMTPVNYISFCDEYNGGNYKIKDIYGKVWDLKQDNIKYIFSKSQFKMYKYYESWDEYKEYFKKYSCRANMCNLEPDTNEFRKACFNYQMWQTLLDITDEEIEYFTDKVDEFITKGYSDRDVMLEMLGADKNNKNKNYFQKCLEIYPELLRDYHVKEELASQLNARKKEAKYGKFKINATYTFLLPDVYAWLQNMFLHIDTPEGILKNNSVSCRLFKEYNELLVNRSPHLYREHAVRNNVIDKKTKKWFATDGVYTSSHDLISKILQFDNDGDRGLVIADEVLLNVAKRNMKDIVPLYYEMGKASPQIINEQNIYESLTKAFKFNNIGKFSNKLTVMWNDTEIVDSGKNADLTVMKQITALNNFTIDGAKTLLVPKVPNDVNEQMKKSNGKLPYFFQFAKDKHQEDVAPINNSTVNRICRNIENIKQGNYNFKSVGRFRYTMLMNNPNIDIKDEIIDKYKELENKKKEYIIRSKSNNFDITDTFLSINKQVETYFIEECNNLKISRSEGVDMVIAYIYSSNRNNKKAFLFDIFGEIIYENLKKNIKSPLNEGYIMCKNCGKRIKQTNGKREYCEKCSKKIDREKAKERMKNVRFVNIV